MAVEVTQEHQQFRQSVRAWLQDNVEPGWRERFATFNEVAPYLREWDRRYFEAGWGAIRWPREHGGLGADAVQRAIFASECAEFDAPEGLGRLGRRLVAPSLMAHGSSHQLEHLPRILRGDEVWCQGFSEPEAGSDLGAIQTRAEPVNGGWRITGQKVWTSFAQFADWMFLLARTDTSTKHAGLSLFLVPMDTPGITISPIVTITGHAEFNELALDEIFVPEDQIVGDVNQGWNIAMEVLRDERGAEFCLQRFASVRRSFERVLDHVRSEGQEWALADVGAAHAQLYAIPLMARSLLEQESGVQETVPGFESLVKLYTTETWRTFGDAQPTDFGLATFEFAGAQHNDDYYEARHYTISAGTSEIQRNVVAKGYLGLPSSRPKK